MLSRRQAVRLLAATPAAAQGFEAQLPTGFERPWIGPEYWANPLQDWRLRDGRMECFVPGGDRNVYLLTHEVSSGAGTVAMRVRFGQLDRLGPSQGFVGFRIGIRGFFNDFRDSAIYGYGLDAGITHDGRLFIGKLADSPPIEATLNNLDLILEVDAASTVTLKIADAQGRELGAIHRTGFTAKTFTGGVALVCHSGEIRESPDPSSIIQTMSGFNKRDWDRGGTMRYWFRNWTVAGTRVRAYPERAWGPVLFAMHTLSRGTMKMTVQLAPVEDSPLQVELHIRGRRVAASSVDPQSRTAHFRITGWDDRRDTPYRVTYGKASYEGTIRRDPKDHTKLTVAALTCINDLGFPHSEIVNNLRHFKPDFCTFLGDQIYERSAGYGTQRAPLEPAILDYLRKWYLFGWSFRDILRETPAVCLPDDHDVYHGNIWGAAGRKAEGMGQPGQDSGGYTQPAVWVNVVQRTQTSHMPDPPDPAPVDQNISVYFCDLLYGGVSFAVLEDRKWKSAPKQLMPEAKIVNGWVQNPDFKPPIHGDPPGAQLLGPRQEKFLERWAADWDGAWFKCVLSQTIFANVATLPPPANTDAVTPKLPVEPVGGYAEGEVHTADHDSNAWPASGRNRALRAMRKCAAFHIAGDQHLGSTVQYGIDDWNDASWAICVPAVSNLFPRRWYPADEGRNRKPGMPRNTGDFLDGFGNRVTVHAVFNPQAVDFEPVVVNRRAPGFGIIEFDRATRNITATNWPRWVDASKPGAKPADGWPITIHQGANGLPAPRWVLDAVKAGIPNAIVQVIDEANGEIVYTVRAQSDSFTPAVWRDGTYTVRMWKDRSSKPLAVRKGLKPRQA